MNPIKAKDPCNATKAHNPPNCNHLVKSPCASGPQRSNKEWPILLGGVETAAVNTLQPSRKEVANNRLKILPKEHYKQITA